MNNDPQFMQYCKILGIDSNTIRNKIVKNVPMTITKQQKGCICQIINLKKKIFSMKLWTTLIILIDNTMLTV